MMRVWTVLWLFLVPCCYGDERIKRQIGVSGGDACLQIYTVPKQTVKCEPTDEVVQEFERLLGLIEKNQASATALSDRVDGMDSGQTIDLSEEVREKLAAVGSLEVLTGDMKTDLQLLRTNMTKFLSKVEQLEMDEQEEIRGMMTLQSGLVERVLEHANQSTHEEYIKKLEEHSAHLHEHLREFDERLRSDLTDTHDKLHGGMTSLDQKILALIEDMRWKFENDSSVMRKEIGDGLELIQNSNSLSQNTANELTKLKKDINDMDKTGVVLRNTAAGDCQCAGEIDTLKDEVAELKRVIEKRDRIVPRILKARDCQEVLLFYEPISGVYPVFMNGLTVPIEMYCEMESGVGWTVIQRRQDGSTDFFRGWEEYRTGFGDAEGEYWLGLEKMHQLTSAKSYELKVQVQDWNDRRYTAQYRDFRIDSEEEFYRLHISGYHGDGNAGDSMVMHDGMPFSTMDKNNDENNGICATWCHGAWWYKDCFHSNLNGRYYTSGPYVTKTGWGDGVVWRSVQNTNFYSLKRSVMMIKPSY